MTFLVIQNHIIFSCSLKSYNFISFIRYIIFYNINNNMEPHNTNYLKDLKKKDS